ncbi:MAG: hypothetical protein V4795_08260 [Pseudomonadota bacterium]
MTLDEPRPMPTTRRTLPKPPVPTWAIPTLGDVVARIGAEVAAPLTAALERVVALASSGRIDRHGLQALRSEIDGARRVGLRGQQIARLASGAVRQTVERLDLTLCLREVLHGMAVHANGQAIAVPPAPTRAEVLGDASLLHAVLDAAADWSAALARANVEWRIDVKPWPVRARVLCRFAHRPADHVSPRPPHGDGADPAHHENSLDTLDWLLLTYTAHIAGVVVQRQDGPSHTLLTLEFLNTVNGTLEGAAAVDLVASADGGAQAIAGCQLLVLASQRGTRQRLRDATQGHDLLVDYVSTVADAALFCQDGAPQVLVFESAFNGDALAALQAQLGRSAPGMTHIELLPAGDDCNLSVPGANPVTQLGIDALHHMLLPVLVLELGRASQG